MTTQASADVLPADEGHGAYRLRKLLSDNPYQPGTWQANEWDFGWTCDEESDPNESFDRTTQSFKSNC